MFFLKTVKNRTFSRIFATMLIALLVVFDINFAHADLVSASSIMCPNVLHDGERASSCSKSGVCVGANTSGLSNGDFAIEFDYGTIVGGSQCVSASSGSYDCKCNIKTFTPTNGELESSLSSSITLANYSNQGTSTNLSNCNSACASSCANKIKKDFQFRESLYASAVGCVVTENYPSQPCDNLLKNGTENISYQTSSSTIGNTNLTQNFQTGDWAVEFDYGTIVGSSQCVSASYGSYDCKCNTQTFTPTNGELERALSGSIKLSNYSNQGTSTNLSNCTSACASGCATKVKKDFQFRKSLYNTKMNPQCTVTLAPRDYVCDAVLHDGTDISYKTSSATVGDTNLTQNFQTGDWAVEFDYGIVGGASQCASASSGSYDCKCNTKTFTPTNAESESALSGSITLANYSNQGTSTNLSNCNSACASSCANKVKKDFQFREKLYVFADSFNCPISSTYPENLKSTETTLIDGKTISYMTSTTTSGDTNLTQNFQTGDWAVEFDYGTIVGGSQCASASSGSYDCKCNTQTFTPTDNEIERALSGSITIANYSNQGTSTNLSNCNSACASSCANKVKKDFQFRESVFGGTHTNATDLACQDSALPGNSLSYMTSTNTVGNTNLTQNFQTGDWAVEFDYGIIVGGSQCVSASYGSYDCKCNTQTFTPTNGELERALSGSIKLSNYSNQGTSTNLSNCNSACASSCANKFNTDQTFREKFLSTNVVGECSGAAHKYAITYDNRGGTGCNSLSYGDDESVSLCEPAYTPKRFTGWATTSTGEPEYPAGYTVEKRSMSLFANWNENCGDGLYGEAGSCQACPNGFNHTRSGSMSNTQCYAICPDTPTCPQNVATCKYADADENNYDYYDEGEASICDIEVLTCESGSIMNNNKSACIQCSKVLYNDECVNECPSGTTPVNGRCETSTTQTIITLDWNENNGSELPNDSCAYNQDLRLPSAPTRDGYTFTGWKLADNSIHNADETITGGCIDTYIGTTSGTSNIITAQWSDCGTGYYCQNGVKTQCPSAYPNTDSANITSVTDCYAIKTATCTQNECSNPDTIGCSGATCGSCSCTGTTYKQYSNSDGTGDGITDGTTSESCDKPVVSLTAKLSYYVNGTSGCPICPEGYREGTNAQNIHECYHECTTSNIANSSVVTGNDYYGMPDTCFALSCATHYHIYTTPDLMSTIGTTDANGFTCNNSTGSESYTDNMSNTIIANDPMAFAVDYGNKGLIKGHGRCSSRYATNPWVGTNGGYVLQSDSTVNVNDLANQTDPENGGGNCYCHMDSYTASGSNMSLAISNPWLFVTYDDAESCANYCAVYCANFMFHNNQENLSFRTMMFELSKSGCEPDVYTVTYNTNGGTAIDSVEYTYGTPAITLPQPTRDNYTFGGWYSDSGLQNIVDNSYTPTESVTLYAKWSDCGTGYYCQNGVKTQCPDDYPHTDSANVSSITDCYAIKTATCNKNDCTNPDPTGCDIVCEDCSCMGDTYKQYSNSDGTGDGATIGTTSESCDKELISLSAKANHYLDNDTCPACNVPFTTVESETSGSTCPDGTVKAHATGTQQSYSLTCYHQTSTGGEIDSSECTGTQSCEERDYNTCEITGCDSGYYLTSDNTVCQECPLGYTCAGGTDTPREIPTDTNCRAGQISYEDECVDNNFQITTIPNTKEIKFIFYAAGTYYVDCDTNSTSDTVKKVVVADSQTAMTSGTPVTCSYDIGGEYTIGFGGEATNYIASSIINNDWYYAGTNNCSEWGVFRIGEQSNSGFTSHTSKIKNLSGSIGKIFPTLPDKPQPTFRSTFSGTTNLTSIPGSLFNGVYGQPGICMFVSTFYGTAATSIPIGLFSYISGTSEGLFMSTFAGSKITSIDPGILRTIKGPARVGMFANMFMDANELRYLPENLFGGIYKVEGIDSTGMLKDAFRKAYNGGIKKLPNTMFSDFNGKPDTATFKNIFAHNTNLSGNYVPCHFFDSLDNTGFNSTGNTSPLDSIFYNTSLLRSCPRNMYKKTTGFEGDFDGAVVCCDCPNGGTSDGGTGGLNSCSEASVVCSAGQYLASDQTSCSACPSAYPNSPSGARSISQCYATVTYKFNNGAEDISVDIPYSSDSSNSYTIKLPEPAKPDYIFVGWNEQQDFSGDVLTDTAILSGNKILYAQWTQLKCNSGYYLATNGLSCLQCPTAYPNSIFDSKNIYDCFATVTFYPNNATDNTKENYYYTDALPNGYKITNTPATNTNYEFIGWFDNQNFTGTAITNQSILVGNKSLYAQYGYSIQYDLDGGTLPNGQTNPSGYTDTTSTFTLNNPIKTGYTFTGWCESNRNCTNPETTVTIIQGSSTGNKYYYAKWTANTYNIIYKDGSDVLSTIQSPTSYTFSTSDQTFTPTPAPTKRGFSFIGWTTSLTDQTNHNTTITVPANTAEDVTFYAVWELIGYDIHYNLNGGTNDQRNPDTYIISELPLPLYDATRTGYIFDGWFNNSGLAGTALTEISSDTVGELTLYAKWTPITYNVVFNGNKADGYKSAVVCTYDQYCDISNNNNFTYDGYIYMGWDTNKNATTPIYPNTSSGISVLNLTSVNNDTILLYAIWKEHRIDLQYLYNDSQGSVEQSSCKYNYIFTPPVPPADAKPGFRFAGWRIETN